MAELDNWKTQIKKGYLELCLLSLIEGRRRLYGLEILELLDKASLPLKEGTLYPLLNRMTQDGTLEAAWETDHAKGHPRKFYSLTREGKLALAEMRAEFERMNKIFDRLSQGG